MARLGLIAGDRRFPLLLAMEARKNNYSVVAVAIKGETQPKLSKLVDKIYWLGLNEFSRLFEVFKNEKIDQVVMAGQISPRQLFRPLIRNSPELRELLDSLQDKRADTIFGGIARKLESYRIKVLDSTFLLKSFLPSKGTLSVIQPNFGQWEDIYLGLSVAKEIARLDIGQTVAIKDKAIVGIEALEGTDNLIKRAGKITRAGVIIMKVSKPAQDLRFDVPVVGLDTIKRLISVRAAGLAIEADKTLFIDQEESLNLSNKKGIFVVAV